MEESVRESCTKMVQEFHTTTDAGSKKFQRELGRIYYVTPTSYLELISTFDKLLAQKRTEVANLRDRYGNGYKTLVSTEEKVNTL
jgi:dynein heavy chain